MAKAKKPASGSKSTSQMPKETAVKAKAAEAKKVEATEAVTPTKATKASASKPASSASASTAPAKPKPAETPVSDKAKPVETKATTTPEVKETPAKPTTPTPAPKQAAPTPRQEPVESKSVFWPLVFGGVIAGGLGFMVSELDLLNRSADTANIEQTVKAQQKRIVSLENAETSDAGLKEIQTGIASLSDMVSTLETRLKELESRPVVSVDGASPEYAEGLAALQSSVEQQKDEIQQLLKNAQSVEEATASAARQAAVQGALTKITTALSTGAGFADAVDQLNANDVSDLPAVLTENAADGVATLLSLQSGFADAARSALSSARSAGSEQSEGGVGAFLKRQLGARSVAPREGSDADAVLSRAEAAVRDGRVADALAEIDALPVPAQDAMADWLASARPRAAAETAVQDLFQRLTAN